MPTLRSFTPDGETIAARWRENVLSTEDWRGNINPGAPQGEAAGYFVTSGTINAYAKPSKIDASVPRAAHEKIAADLAFDLGLPLPPLILYEWAGAPPLGGETGVALSLVPFLSVHKWQTVDAVPGLGDEFGAELREVASAMVPFDTWLQNTDRHNGGNLLVSADQLEPGQTVRVAYIDYSYSMLYAWVKQAKAVDNCILVEAYPVHEPDVDKTALERSLSAIESYDPQKIEAVVARIPDAFLPADSKSTVVDALTRRRSLIRTSVESKYGVLS